MPQYSQRSADNLSQCHPVLQRIFNEIIINYDCSIMCGHRGEADQNIAFATYHSKVKWPNSKHNSTPSEAVDAYPCIGGKVSHDPIDCAVLAGIVFMMAVRQGVRDLIRWGGDWDSDHDAAECGENDFGHFEIRQI